MAKKSPAKELIPAVAYVRKSTKGTRPDGRERQEKSLSQQRTEITNLAKGRYNIVRWLADEGVSGWKRNGKRPQFDRLLQEAKDRGDFQVVICDDLDRFSRAEVKEVFSDLTQLSGAGVHTIHCVNQGVYDLGDNDIGRIIKLVVDIHGGNEFSRKLSRRVALAHRNRAIDGKRAGVAPYGMANDGKGGLVHGDRQHLKIVRRIFNRFVERKQSMNSIAAELNEEKIPAPRGGKWFVGGIKELLQRPAYRGDFTYGRRQQGRFFTTAKDKEVVEVTEQGNRWKNGEPAFRKEGAYTPVVPKAVWDEAQRRLASFSLKGSRRPRKEGFPLAGVLLCDHCGKPMYGCQPTGRKYRVYRCSTSAKSGMRSCPSGGIPEIREELILPQVLKMLGEEVEDITKLLTSPPDDLVAPGRKRREQRDDRQEDREALNRKIDQAVENLLFATDARTRQMMDSKINALRKQLDEMDAALEVKHEPDYRRDELQAIADWWNEFTKRAVSLPMPPGKLPVEAHLYQDPFSETGALLIDARVVNEALHMLGAEVRLRWSKRSIKLPSGKQQNRYTLVGGRFLLGQQAGKVTGKNGVMFCKAGSVARCNGIRGGGRCDSRRGMG